MQKKRVAILASGGGSNAEVLMNAMADPAFPAQAVLVFSNKKDAGVLQRAAKYQVPVAVLSHKDFESREDFDLAVIKILKKAQPDFICLAGYMRILTPAFIEAFRGQLLNVHPALLPKHGGPGMHGHYVHEAVLRAGDTESGATVHWVTEEVDGGGILLQRKVPVLPGDRADVLAARVLEAEHLVYPEALRQACLGII
jgi:phosphoribosylglycinamide formyltransferase-1